MNKNNYPPSKILAISFSPFDMFIKIIQDAEIAAV